MYKKDRQRPKELIEVVFEEQNLFERLSAARNLHFNSWLYNLSEKRVKEVLELLHLIELTNISVPTFSSGVKQRLMVARALLHDITVLFLDKPTRGLDLFASHDVRRRFSGSARTLRPYY
jgi:ABC-2 type transport system ATP-binding protein